MIQHRHFLSAKQAEAKIISDILDNEFEEDGIPVSFYEIDEKSDIWGVAIYANEEYSVPLKARMEGALKAQNIELKLSTQIIEETDWVATTLRQLAPVRAGRYVIHGSHDSDAAGPGDIALKIDAGLAFGTGHHGTTAGCLDMLETQMKRRKFTNPLDVGTGSGILAIALAKATKLEVLASDIDPVATSVTNENARINNVAPLITAITASGFNHNEIRNRAPYDLVIANILARPLQDMAKEFARHLDQDAIVILSGLLPHQRARIIKAFQIQGLRFIKSHIRDGWLILVLQAQ